MENLLSAFLDKVGIQLTQAQRAKLLAAMISEDSDKLSSFILDNESLWEGDRRQMLRILSSLSLLRLLFEEGSFTQEEIIAKVAPTDKLIDHFGYSTKIETTVSGNINSSNLESDIQIKTDKKVSTSTWDSNELLDIPAESIQSLLAISLAKLQRRSTKDDFKVSVQELKNEAIDAQRSSFSTAISSLLKNMTSNLKTDIEKTSLKRSYYQTFGIPSISSEFATANLFRHKISYRGKLPYSESGVRLSTNDIINGSFEDIVHFLLPLTDSSDTMIQTIDSFVKLVMNESLLRKIIDKVVTENVVRGRTRYHKNKVIFMSRVLEGINNALSELSISARTQVTIPLVVLFIGELKNSGLINTDIDFDISFKRPVEIDFTVDYFKRAFIVEEFKKLLSNYQKENDRVAYNEDFVSPQEIISNIQRNRLMLARELETLSLISESFDNALTVAMAAIFNIPSKLLTYSAQMENSSLVKFLVGSWELTKELPSRWDISKIMSLDTYEAQFVASLNWLESRFSALNLYYTDALSIIDEFTVIRGEVLRRELPSIILHQNTSVMTNITFGRPVKFIAGRAAMINVKSRKALSDRFESLTTTIRDTFSGPKYSKFLKQLLDFGSIPASTYAISSYSRDDLQLLNIALNNGEVNFHGINLSDSYTNNGYDFKNLSELPQEFKIVYPIYLRSLSKAESVITSNVAFNEDLETSIYSLLMERGIEREATQSRHTVEDSIFLSDKLGIIISPILDSTLSSNFKMSAEINDFQKSVKFEQTLANLMPLSLVETSTAFFKSNHSISLTNNVVFMLSLLNFADWSSRLTSKIQKQRHLVTSSFVFDYLSEMVSRPEILRHLTTILSRRVGLELNGYLSNSFNDVEPIAENLVVNNVSAILVCALFDHFGLSDAKSIKELFDYAQTSPQWVSARLLAIDNDMTQRAK